MAERIEFLAEVSVARGCGFAALAIATTMVGFAGDIRMSLQCGGYLTLIACLILMLKGLSSERKPYNHTEVWIMLEPEERPPRTIAQVVIGRALREVYLRFALRAAWIAAALLVMAVLATMPAPGIVRGSPV
jgi:hypothetical protein